MDERDGGRDANKVLVVEEDRTRGSGFESMKWMKDSDKSDAVVKE